MFFYAVVDCGVPCSPENGRVIFNMTNFESVASYECNHACNNATDVSTTCTENGTWSGSIPICPGKLQVLIFWISTKY